METIRSDYGYQCYWHVFPYNRKANYFRHQDEALFKGMVSFNAVCVGKSAKVPAPISSLYPFENVWTDRLCSGDAAYCAGNQRTLNQVAVTCDRISSLQVAGKSLTPCSQDRQLQDGESLLDEALVLSEIQGIVRPRSMQWKADHNYRYANKFTGTEATVNMEEYCCNICAETEECSCFRFQPIVLAPRSAVVHDTATKISDGECVLLSRCRYTVSEL
jgi:hypothetical protein